MEQVKQKSIGSRVVITVIAVVLAVFLLMVLVPQSFWVNLSIKLFK
jgi:hypothetical protein